MTILTDGDRSSKKTWFAGKLLRDIEMLDLPSKLLSINGFTYKVWRMDELSGGSIQAAPGVAVLCSHENGVDLHVAETAQSGFVGPIPMDTVYRGITGITSAVISLMDRPENPVGVDTIKLRPIGQLSPRVENDPTAIPLRWVSPARPPEEPYHPDNWPTLCVDCLAGEALMVSLSYNEFVDLNGNDLPDFPKYLIEIFQNAYIGNGSVTNKRYSLAIETSEDTGVPASRFLLGLPSVDGKRFAHVHTWSYEVYNGELVVGLDLIAGKESLAVGFVYASNAWAGIDSGVLAILLDWGDPAGLQMSPLGNYAFSTSRENGPTFLHAVNMSGTFPIGGDIIEAYFDANPAAEEWRLFYSIVDQDGTSYSISSSQFLPLLDSLALTGPILVGGDIDWEIARRMLEQFFVWPANYNWAAPCDSAMFHKHDGDIYVWTRVYGAVKFTRSGMFSAEVFLPAEVVTVDGVRPEISYAGSYVEEFVVNYLYVCICNNMNTPSKIDAVYYGTPFIAASWTKIPALTGYDLLYIRPNVVSETYRELWGIAKKDGSCFFCRYSDNSPAATTDGWKVMGKINVEHAELMTWSATFFGGKRSEYLSPPHVMPGMPVGPYDSYSLGNP